MFNLPGRGFRPRITLTSSVPMTLNDVIVHVSSLQCTGRRRTPTNTSHHLKLQKLGVVRTLMNRCETITSEEGDKKEEVEHLRGALRVCGYPSWALNKVTDSRKKKKNNNKKQITEITGAK